jgi:multidrug efflux pump subunit AcrA (membrane-fusion protein)
MGKKWVLPVLGLVLVAWSTWKVFGAQNEKKGKPDTAETLQAPYKHSVSGNGVVEPRTEASGTAKVAVGVELPGVVVEVYEKAKQAFVSGKTVQKGEPLFRLDDTALKAALMEKDAALVVAKKELERLLESRGLELATLESKVTEAKVKLAAAKDALQRGIAAGPAVPPGELIQLRQAYAGAGQELTTARSNVELLRKQRWGPDEVILRSKEKLAEEAVKKVKTDIDERLVIRAPLTGRILELNVRPGEPVAPQPGKAYVMMGDVSVLHVRVSVDEADIGRYLSAPQARRPGARAVAFTRGDKPIEVPLKFVREEAVVMPKKSLTGDTTERVDTRVMQLIYAIDTANAPVLIDQQLDVFIDLTPAGA